MTFLILKFQNMACFEENYLTLTRPIGLPPHAPVAQKIADQRWLIATQ